MLGKSRLIWCRNWVVRRVGGVALQRRTSEFVDIVFIAWGDAVLYDAVSRGVVCHVSHCRLVFGVFDEVLGSVLGVRHGLEVS